MDTITDNIMQHATDHVLSATMIGVDVHTVTITLNGQHGGADVKVEGTTFVSPRQGLLTDWDEWVREYVVR